jgi:hypothetical protein
LDPSRWGCPVGVSSVQCCDALVDRSTGPVERPDEKHTRPAQRNAERPRASLIAERIAERPRASDMLSLRAEEVTLLRAVLLPVLLAGEGVGLAARREGGGEIL